MTARGSLGAIWALTCRGEDKRLLRGLGYRIVAPAVIQRPGMVTPAISW